MTDPAAARCLCGNNFANPDPYCPVHDADPAAARSGAAPQPTDEELRTRVERIVAFHCVPGTFDGCQGDHDDPDFLALCSHCQTLADQVLAALAAARLAQQQENEHLKARLLEQAVRETRAEAAVTALRQEIEELRKWVEASDCCYGGSCIANEMEKRVGDLADRLARLAPRPKDGEKE